jgi:hypothetical protein
MILTRYETESMGSMSPQAKPSMMEWATPEPNNLETYAMANFISTKHTSDFTSDNLSKLNSSTAPIYDTVYGDVEISELVENIK